jgi:ferredoxin
MILYFSGTGNSRYAAFRLHQTLGGQLVDLNERIRNHDYTPLVSRSPFILAAPTYAWSLPRVVEEYLRQTPLQGDARLYAVLTCGGSSGGAEGRLRRLAEDLQLDFRGLAEIQMPENYIAMYKAPGREHAEAILRRAEELLDQTARRIEEGRVLPPLKKGPLGAIQTNLINPLFYAMCVSASKFYSTDACTGCGRCAELCPLNNIEIKEGRPVWGDSCTHCMACICGCPEEAIEYGKKSRGKRRYYLDEKGRQR